MDTFLNHVTVQNAPAWRDEVFSVLNAPQPANETGLESVREWIREAVNPNTALSQYYRTLELDLEDDIARSLPAFRVSPYFGPREACYSLRMLWRVLLRRHAIGAARAVDRELAATKEKWIWRWSRRKDYLHPRLAVGVLLGFFVLGSSTGIVDTIYRLRLHWWWPATVAACAMVVYLLAVAHVQRQVGRMPVKEILLRAGRVVVLGVLYAALGAGLQWLRTSLLAYEAPNYGPIAAMCGGVALLLGFVFQLFWQDRSIGEPL
jgi:hypothetical protein